MDKNSMISLAGHSDIINSGRTMRHILRLTILSVILAFATLAKADNAHSKRLLLEKYQKELASQATSRDSIKVLYNIFDLSDRAGQKRVGWILYETAGRAGDISTQMDMLRNLAVFYAGNDSVIAELQKLTALIPNHDARIATKTFISNQQFNRKSRYPNDKQYEKMLLDSIHNSHNLKGTDKYDKIALLYQIIQFLGVDADGALFRESFDKYQKMITKLPASDYPLKNQYYTTSALIYSRTGEHAKAIECDRRLLETIDQLQQMHVKKNRKFRNYAPNKFICYRRILSNYPALSPQQVEAVHDSIINFLENDPDVKAIYTRDGHSDALYLMATKQYKEAIPCIRKALQNPGLSHYQKVLFYDLLRDAARETGDEPLQILAMENARISLGVLDSLRREAADRELLLRKYLTDTPLLRDEPKSNNKRDYDPNKDTKMTLMIISVVLSILLVIYVTLYIRLRLQRRNHRS